MNIRWISILVMVAVLGCGQAGSGDQATPTVAKAIAVVMATAGNSVSGEITFQATDQGIRVTGRLEGLTPGEHGFHIHQYGDCSAPDGSSAGGHFNPANSAHASPTSAERHVGDLGNITADEHGIVELDMVDSQLAFSGPNSIIGRAVVVHGGPDDFTSQPSGAAGPRVGCGVIGIASN